PVPAIWPGSANTWINLAGGTANGAGAVYGVWGGTQVGNLGSGGASLWHGTHESRVILHPSQATSSTAEAVSGNQQVGRARIATIDHASLWYGTAASWVDLHPAGAVRSEAAATDGIHQGGGFVLATGEQHA